MTGREPDGRARGGRRAVAVLAALALLLLAGSAVRWGLFDGDRDDRSATGRDAAAGSGDGDDGSDPAGAAGSGATPGGDPQADGTDRSRAGPRSTRRAAAPTAAADAASKRDGEDAPRESSTDASGRRSTAQLRPRFTLVGEEGAHPHRRFGEDVAIDGDVAVIAAPGFEVGGRPCGAAYVFERREDVWAQTQRIDSPRTDLYGFASRVGVAGGRIAVFGGTARHSNKPVFRSYVRGGDGAWVEEAEVELEGGGWDAELRGTTVVTGRHGAVDIFEAVDGRWTLTQSLEAPPNRHPARFGRWISLLGDTLAVASDDTGRDQRVPVYLYRRADGGFQPEATLWFERSAEESHGSLARAGAALVVPLSYASPLAIDERSDSGWSRSQVGNAVPGSFEWANRRPAVAAHGELVVTTVNSVATPKGGSVVVLERKGDAWSWTSIEVPAAFRTTSFFPSLALSGRTAVFGGDWWIDLQAGGRVWFVEITDEDLARATPLVPEARKDGRQDRSLAR